ncbi:MAG: CRISPR-associated helicase Cas3' [Acidobacteriota bacterium]|nr:CRISPR-associated helicase Cas3' [Blastocatellia bacterium]MDW8413224.1 CRISPR-associated helicase Cas3' [Acidobacteriota bacterium]
MFATHLLLRFWAKTTHDKINYPKAFHPLLCHMIDVAAVTQTMWDKVLSTALKERISCALGLTSITGIEQTGKIVSWIAGLHDLGKASPPFAHRYTEQQIHQIYQGTKFERAQLPLPPPKQAPHGYVTAIALERILTDFGFGWKLAEKMGIITGSHHGKFPNSSEIKDIEGNDSKLGGKSWKTARLELAKVLHEVLCVPTLTLDPKLDIDNASALILAGLVSVADWIGSNTEFFKCKVTDQANIPQIDLYSYKEEAFNNARAALSKLGWLDQPEAIYHKRFCELFPNIVKNNLQDTVETLAEKLRSPGIVVIEAPMGEGKTEAAMFLADFWNATLKQRGIYFALPTQATSNQMFSRVKNFLAARYPHEKVLLQLLHGHASLSAEFETLLKQHEKLLSMSEIYADEQTHSCLASVVAAEWFTHRKRGLLAPFGVGTVDQALLAVLQVQHVFVRLFGLAHKTVIIDEVHAYDAYMSVLLERLLNWLATLGSPVILLSATLPADKRNSLVKAYLKGLSEEGSWHTSGSYPSITWATKQDIGTIEIRTSQQKLINLCSVTLESLGEALKEALADGGCVAVICNTVERAQEVFLKLRQHFPGTSNDSLPEVDLLHARFLYTDRAKRELRCLIRFGKENSSVVDSQGKEHPVIRPKRAILVATQVIEQSLDLDFDLMISEHAPVDLLLQRAGRLHRHVRKQRPQRLSEPTLWIISSQEGFGNSSLIYDEHILLRSQLAIDKLQRIRIPEDVSQLTEYVYSNNQPCTDESLSNHWEATEKKLRNRIQDKEHRARNKRIASPLNKNLLNEFSSFLEEDNPEFHKSLQACTRDDESPSIQVVILQEKQAESKCARNIAETKYLLQRSVTISSPRIVYELIDQSPPPEWQENALLRHHRLLVVNSAGEVTVGKYLLKLDDQLGIVIKGE